MNTSVQVATGRQTIRRLLQEQDYSLRDLDLAHFRIWLEGHVARWHGDAVFVQRVKIRELRRASPQLRELEKEHRLAISADAAAPHFGKLARLERELVGADKAIVGLTVAIKAARGKSRRNLQDKLRAMRVRRESLRENQAILLQSSPERQARQHIEAQLGQMRAKLGLHREEACINNLLKQQGRRTTRGGTAFEQLAMEITRQHIVPGLLRAGQQEAQRLRVLTRVTLGAARTEFDQLVVRLPRREGGPVQVLAVVEVKRNLNDLAHGFRQRQADLAWFTSDTSAYDAQQYRTRHFATGHFERAASHVHEGETFRFTSSSFRRFRRDAESCYFLDHLYLITRPGPMWGVSSAVLSRIAFRVATDEHWTPEDRRYMDRLRRWCQALTEPLETPELLKLYDATSRRARQILLART